MRFIETPTSITLLPIITAHLEPSAFLESFIISNERYKFALEVEPSTKQNLAYINGLDDDFGIYERRHLLAQQKGSLDRRLLSSSLKNGRLVFVYFQPIRSNTRAIS